MRGFQAPVGQMFSGPGIAIERNVIGTHTPYDCVKSLKVVKLS